MKVSHNAASSLDLWQSHWATVDLGRTACLTKSGSRYPRAGLGSYSNLRGCRFLLCTNPCDVPLHKGMKPPRFLSLENLTHSSWLQKKNTKTCPTLNGPILLYLLRDDSLRIRFVEMWQFRCGGVFGEPNSMPVRTYRGCRRMHVYSKPIARAQKAQ